jgi:hypothetical protein
MKTTFRQQQSGSSLIVVTYVTATLMVILGIAAEYSMNVNRNVQRSNTLESAIATGDSCLDILFGNWRSICRQPLNVNLALPTNSFTAIPLPTSSMFPNISNFGASASDYYGTNLPNPPTVSNFKVVAVDAEWTATPTQTATPIPMLGQGSTATNTTTTVVYNYVASADVTLPAVNGNAVAKVRRVFQKQQLSPWNFAIFYIDPLEIHPGPPFTVTGWVHTNSNLYTAHSTLTFAEKVTYASDWFINFKPGDQQHNSDIPASPHYPGNLPPARDQALQPFGMDSTQIFGGPPNPNTADSYRELIEPPNAGYTDPLVAARYWNQASVAIKVDATNNVTIGTPNPTNGTITPFLTTNPLYQMFSSAISTNQTIQDNREGANIRLVTLDISKILQVDGNGNLLNPPAYKSSSFNGIVYIYDSSASSSARRGVRLTKGSKIPPSGLTVASQNPVYVQGDFNTGGTPPSNGNPSDPTRPQVSGYTRAPTSIFGDAVDILSNSWNDANSFGGTSSRVASNTTVNAAIVSGIVPTAPVGGDGSYSGGAENFPRFLEDWSSARLTYYGSMVELYKSQQSIGEWGRANVYVPPTRQWYFDTNFRTISPPGGLMIYTYVKGRWYVL